MNIENLPDPNTYSDWKQFASALVQSLQPLLSFAGIVLPTYTVAQLLAGEPPAAQMGVAVYCPDEAGGKTIAVADGATWRRVSDGAVVS